MKIKLNFATDNMHKENLKNFLKLTLDVTEDKKKVKVDNQKPVFLIPVIDRSGSMAASASNRNGKFTTQLDCAIASTCELLDLLNEGDKFAVVSFDDEIKVEQKPISVTENNRDEVKYNIKKISTGGCTNISDALKTAANLFVTEDTEKYNCKIILLSDGCANVGFREEQQFIEFMPKILNRNISVSTIGLGTNYDAGIMEAISGNCAGSFNHICDALAIKDIFITELKSAQSIVCKDTVVDIILPDMVAFKPNYNNYREEVRKDFIRIRLGSLYSNKTIFYEFSALSEELKEIAITVKVSYENLDGGKDEVAFTHTLPVVDTKEEVVENEAIINEWMVAVKDRYAYEASKAVSANDYASASMSYEASSATMNSILSTYNCCSASLAADMDSIQTSITNCSSQDNLRKTFDTYSKKMRGSN